MTALPQVVAPPARTLMLGKGWFPDQVGGLDRYYRDLLEHLPDATGVVVGPATEAPSRVVAVADDADPALRRLTSFWRAARRAAADAELVDAHFALYAVAPLWLGPLRRTPVLLHFQGPWADENVAAGDRSRVRRVARRLLERAAYRRAAHAIVLTSAFRQVLVERYRVAPWDVSVLAPGVDVEHFTPGPAADARARFGLAPGAFVAACVRRLVPRMGLDVLLDAWAEAVEQLPPGSTLLVAGDGPQRAALDARLRDSPLGASVRLLGRIPDDALVDLYRAADVAVVPTLEHEGFGLVVLEAAACGTPSIVTAVGGLPEAVAGLDRSLIVAPGAPRELASRLVRAREDRPTAAASRDHAERYAWPLVAERHRELARRAVAGTARGDRLRVVYLDHVAQLSGGEIALLRLLPHLDRVEPHVLLAEDGPLVSELHLHGISTEVLPLAARARRLRRAQVGGAVPASAAALTAAYVARLAHRLRQLRPDVVHTNSLKAGVYGSVAARLAGVPIVWHVRDRIADDYLPPAAVRLVRAMTGRLADAVIANSRATMETLSRDLESLVLTSVLPEIMAPRPARVRTGDAPTTYGIVGRLAPWKGQDAFLRAFAHAFGGGDERAVVIGDALFGEDGFARSLPALAASLGIADRVEFRGFRPDIFAELAHLDALVHASLIAEPFGQVVLEGMAAGVPVVAASAGGPAEILRHDETGLLYEPGSIEELAAAMQRLRDPALRDRLSAAAHSDVRRYDPAVVAARLQDLYDAVATRATRGRAR